MTEEKMRVEQCPKCGADVVTRLIFAPPLITDLRPDTYTDSEGMHWTTFRGEGYVKELICIKCSPPSDDSVDYKEQK